MRSPLSLVVLALFAPSLGVAQDSVPPRRAHHALVYDAANRRVLLSGGSTPVDGGNSFTFFDDLWSFDGRRWTALPPSGDRLSGTRLVFDAPRRRVVSFGGFDGSGARGDLRVLEGDRWRTIGTLAEMPAAEPGFVHDARRDRFVAFGGGAGRMQVHGDTWEHDGTQWRKLEVSGPGARQAHVMVYDERRGRVVLFGGMGAPAAAGERPPILGDTWEYDGSRWTRLDVPGPSPRLTPGAAYDSRRGRVILFGGSSPATGFLADTWAWDGAAWRKLADGGPDARGMGHLAYDAARDRVVLFGGRKGYPDGDLNDTWEFDGTRWTRVAP